MSEELALNEIADIMVKFVARDQGSKKYKPQDLFKMVRNDYGVDKKTAKLALRQCLESNPPRLVYTYFGGTFVEIPHVEGAAN